MSGIEIVKTPSIVAKDASAGLIIDVGMYRGGDAEFYLRKGFRVISIEANPTSARQARASLAPWIEKGRLRIFEIAIAHGEKAVPFYVCASEGSWSTADPKIKREWERGGAEFSLIEVPGRHLGRLLRDEGETPHYIKIDIEGHDLLALKQLHEVGLRPPYLSIELTIREAEESLLLLRDMGYHGFQLVPQSQVVRQKEPDPPREGRRAGWVMRKGHSGLFGRELPDDWRSFREARRALRRIRMESLAAAGIRRVGGKLAQHSRMRRTLEQTFPRAYDWYDLHAMA